MPELSHRLSPLPEPYPQYSYGDHGHKHRHGYPKRKKSFLEELFD